LAEERVRIEIGFVGGQVVGAFVEPASADALEGALDGERERAVVLQTEDGPLHVAVSHVAYYRRIVRAGKVGFG